MNGGIFTLRYFENAPNYNKGTFLLKKVITLYTGWTMNSLHKNIAI